MLLAEKGEHRGIYHVGSDVEVSIAELSRQIGLCFNREVRVIAGELSLGSAIRRCPDIARMRSLGFSPRVSLADGLRLTVDWYVRRHL